MAQGIGGVTGGSDGFSGIQNEAVRVEFTVDASPDYAIFDQVGDAVEITNAARYTGGGGIIENVAVHIKDAINADLAFHFFRDEPTSTAGGDNAVIDVSDDDLELFLFSMTVPKGRYHGFTSNQAATLETYLRYQCDATSLWVVCQALTLTNFSQTDGLALVCGLRKD